MKEIRSVLASNDANFAHDAVKTDTSTRPGSSPSPVTAFPNEGTTLQAHKCDCERTQVRDGAIKATKGSAFCPKKGQLLQNDDESWYNICN